MISDVIDKVKRFLKETIEAESVHIIRVDNTDRGSWIVEAEVAEKNQYLASIKPEYRVFEKEHYLVKLNTNLEVFSYKRLHNHEEELEGVNYGL